MSGPKVVRIVTHEEILAICEGHLRRLDQAFVHWQAQAGRLEELDEELLAATLARHVRLRQLLRDDDLLRLQKDVPAEIAFLERDLAQREERAVARATEARKAQRNLRENAATLLHALSGDGTQADAALIEALQSVVEGRSVTDAATILAKGFASLAGAAGAADTGALSEAQRDLARALQAERPDRWVAEEHVVREPRLGRIDGHIARLQTLYGSAAADPFLRRLKAIEGESRPARRDMLLDSLSLDLASTATDYKARSDRVSSLRTLASELEALLGHAGSPLLARVAACLAKPKPGMQQVEALSEQCGEAIAQELRDRAAIARRRAVLEGLASLGYEVREGMETAWAEAGSVVLRKTATPGYGVEVGGRAENGRLQVRAVSLSGIHDRGRDRDIETIWCGEFTRLRALLADQGSELAIEKALGVGEVPLKVIDPESESGNLAYRSDSRSAS